MDRDLKKSLIGILLAIVGVFAVILLIDIPFSFNDTDYTVIVTDKERVGGDDSKYLIFCKNSQGETIVFENTDNLLRGKFNSSDVYGDIKVGKKYTFTVVGFRVPILSMYKNIIKIKEAGD